MNNDNERQYFVCRITDNGEDLYCIWYTDEVDGVVTKDGRVLLWRNEDRAREYARQQQWALAPDAPAMFDLDYILEMEANSSVLRPKDCLDLWNLFSDIARSLGNAEFVRQDAVASDLHARLSAISLSDILNVEQDRLNVTEIDKIVTVLRLGKTMLKERCRVIT